MKKYFLGIISLLISSFSWNIGYAQNNCSQWQDELDKAQEKLDRIEGRKLSYEDFFSLLDGPNSLAYTNIPEEIATCENRIKRLQQKIADGDNSPETAADLKGNQSRVTLLTIRGSRSFDKNTFYKDPRYLEQEKIFNNLKSEETALKIDIARIGNSMKDNNCAIKKKEPGDFEDIDDIIDKPKDEKDKDVIIDKLKAEDKNKPVDPGNFPGSWASYPDSKTEFRLNLKTAGATISGSGTFTAPFVDGTAFVMKYDIRGCADAGAKNKLKCNFTSLVDDAAKRIESAGVVYLTLLNNPPVLSTGWQENAPAKTTDKGRQEISKAEQARQRSYIFVKE